TPSASCRRSPPATGRSRLIGTPCCSMTRTVSKEPTIVAPVRRTIRSAPQRWSKWEWPTRIQSARSTSSAVRPVPGACGTRSTYASRKTTTSPTVRRNVAQPYQSRVAGTPSLPRDRAPVHVGIRELAPLDDLAVAEAHEHDVVVPVPTRRALHLVVAAHLGDHEVGIGRREQFDHLVEDAGEAFLHGLEHGPHLGLPAPGRHLRVIRREVHDVVVDVGELAFLVARGEPFEHDADGLAVAGPPGV